MEEVDQELYGTILQVEVDVLKEEKEEVQMKQKVLEEDLEQGHRFYLKGNLWLLKMLILKRQLVQW